MIHARRHLLALGLAAALAGPALAAPPEAEVEAAVDALSSAMIEADGPALDRLTMDALNYGHSAGTVQDKAAFTASIVGKQPAYPSITLSDRTASVVGDDAIVRHVFKGEAKYPDRTTPVHIGVLQVWHRDAGRWRLLARQAYKL